MHRHGCARAFLVAVAVTAMTALVGAGSASASDTIRWTDESGAKHVVRALSAQEVRARGLDEYVDMSDYQATTPKLRTAKSTAPEPKTGKAASSVGASACWTHWYGYGIFSGPFTLYGKTDVSWCGDGTWVRYANSACTGDDGGYPTYEYLGCERNPDYGVGWNVYDVWSRWHLCPTWVPGTGCISDDRPWGKYRYGGNGGVWRLGGT
jgi:hypothetical protein